MDTDKYYLINNVTGVKTRVNKTGEYIKRFNVLMTGRVGYDERVRLAAGVTRWSAGLLLI